VARERAGWVGGAIVKRIDADGIVTPEAAKLGASATHPLRLATLRVYRVELPLEMAPTLNCHAAMRPWQRAKLRQQLGGVMRDAAWLWTSCALGIVRGPSKRPGMPGPVIDEGHARRRRVVVTRRSSVRPDEVSCDSIGGKAPLDMLVRLGILRDDNARWCERDAKWERAARGAGRVVVDVFEIEKETT